jgi:4-aminobutyrate aminotransferase
MTAEPERGVLEAAERTLHEVQAPAERLSYDELAAFTAPRLRTEVPGPKASAVIRADAKVTSPSLPRAYALVPRRGAGCIVEDVDGNVFLDFNAGIAVCSTGHSHPTVVRAIAEQARELLHYSASDFYLPIYSQTCAVLDEITPVGGTARSFLTNSGTEAVEAAIKLARHNTGRQWVIAFIGGFHGRSYGSVTLTASNAKYHEGFGPLLPGVVHAPYGADDTDRYIENVIFKRLVKPNEVAAIVVEPIQGEGGYVVPPDGWLRYLKDLADRHGIFFIADEVQSGMGRTGTMWATEHWDVAPDMVLAGKGIASGMPLGAMIVREDLMTWKTGAHGSTYGGNPVSCAAALATIDLIRGGLAGNAAAMGPVLLDGLRAIAERHPFVHEVRGLGLMIGVEFADGATADAVEIACFHRGLLTLRAGDATIRMSPPLLVTREQADTGLQIFEDACAEVAAR